MEKLARAIRDASDAVLFVESYDGLRRWASSAEAERAGYEILYNNGPYDNKGQQKRED